MSVRAKMTVVEIKDEDFTGTGGISQRSVRLLPVYTDDPTHVNASWSKYTPWGEVKLGITNPEAFNQFEQGKTYYVDFSPAE